MFPKVKLFTLMIKQIARPVANSLSESAKRNHQFRSYMVRIGKRYHVTQSKLFGFGNPPRMTPISEDEAIHLGTSLLREIFVYGVSAAVLLYHYNRSSRNDQTKEERRKLEIASLQRKIYEYGMATEKREREIKELKSKMFVLENKHRSLENKVFTKHNDIVM